LLGVVAGFFFCVVVLELCAYPTVIATHNTAPVTHCQPKPESFVTTSTLIRLYGVRKDSASTPAPHPNLGR
jgi:hypothetical protein